MTWLSRKAPRWLMALVVVALSMVGLFLPGMGDVVMIGALMLALAVIVVTRYRDVLAWLERIHSRLFMLVALILIAFATVFFFPDPDAVFPWTPRVGQAMLAFGAAAGFLLFALWLRESDSPSIAESEPESTGTPPRWAYRPLVVTCGAGLVLFAAEASAGALKVPWLEHLHYNVQIGAWLAGLVLLTFGMGYTPRTENAPSRQHAIPIPRWEGVVIAGIALLALFLRWWELDTRLLTLVDELNFVSHVRHFWEFSDNPVFRPMTDIVPFTRVFSYGGSITIAIFGRNYEGIRAFSGLIGMANVIALWWLARQIVDRRVALVAALLLATFPPHLHFSRLALNNIVDPLFGTLAFGFILRGLRTEKRMDYALAGLCLGLIPYFYEGGRLLFPIIFVLWGVWVVWVMWNQRITPVQRQNLAVLAITAAIMAFPVYYNIASWTGNLTGRMAFSGLSAGYWETLVVGDTASALRGYFDNLGRSLLFYFNRFEIFIHYGGHYALIIPLLVPAFLLGLIYALWGTLRRQHGLALMLFWFVLATLGNSALVDPGVSTRHVVNFPVVAFMMALGVIWTVDLLATKHSLLVIVPHARAFIEPAGKSITLMSIAVGTLIVVLMGIRQTNYYFNTHLPQVEAQIRELAPYRDVNDALIRAVDLPPGTHINLISDYLYSGRDSADLMSYLADGMMVSTVMNYDMPVNYMMTLDYTQTQAFLVPPNDEETQHLIRSHFGTLPDPQMTTNPNVNRDEELWLYVIPPTVYHVPVDPATIRDIPARHERSLVHMGVAVFGVMLTVGGVFLLERYAPATLTPVKARAGRVLVFFQTEEQHISFIPRPTTFVTGLILLLAVTLLNSSEDPVLTMPVWMQLGGLLAGVGLVVRGFLPDVREAKPARTLHLSDLLPRRLRLYRPAPNAMIQRPSSLVNGFILLALVTVANMIDRPEVCLPVWLQLGFFAGGMVLIVRGVSLNGVPRSAPEISPEVPLPERIKAYRNAWADRIRAFDLQTFLVTHWEGVALGGIVLIGMAVRVANLEYGVHWFVDEMHSVSAINRLRDMPYTAIFKPYGEVTAFTWLYPILQNIGVSIYGETLTGLRVVSVLAGTATIGAVWWLARGLFDRRVALIAALVLATFPPHIHFSRIGINNIADPLFGTLALAFLAQAFLRERAEANRINFALAGVALGMTQYFYEGGRLLYPSLTLGWIIVWLIVKRLRVDWRGLFIMGITFALTSAPVYLTWRAGAINSAPRLAENVNQANFYYLLQMEDFSGAVSEFFRAIQAPITMLFGATDQSWFYGGDFGLILPLLLPCFLIGLVWIVRRFYEPRRALFFLWMAGVVIGVALLELQRESPRYVVIFPALALMIALGLDQVYGWLAQRMRGRRWILLACIVALCGAQVVYYFGIHLPRYNAQNREAAIFDDMLFRLVTLPVGTQVYVISDGTIWVEDITTMLEFHERRNNLTIRVMSPEEVNAAFVDELPARGQFAFFIHTQDERVEVSLQSRFDLSRVFFSPYNTLPEDEQYLLYFISA